MAGRGQLAHWFVVAFSMQAAGREFVQRAPRSPSLFRMTRERRETSNERAHAGADDAYHQADELNQSAERGSCFEEVHANSYQKKHNDLFKGEVKTVLECKRKCHSNNCKSMDVKFLGHNKYKCYLSSTLAGTDEGGKLKKGNDNSYYVRRPNCVFYQKREDVYQEGHNDISLRVFGANWTHVSSVRQCELLCCGHGCESFDLTPDGKSFKCHLSSTLAGGPGGGRLIDSNGGSSYHVRKSQGSNLCGENDMSAMVRIAQESVYSLKNAAGWKIELKKRIHDDPVAIYKKVNTNMCALAFAGTGGDVLGKASDWMNNVNSVPINRCGFSGVHNGFWLELRRHLESWTFKNEFMPYLEKSCETVWAVGHSLGGAVASLFAAFVNNAPCRDLHKKYFPESPGFRVSRLYTIGAPAVSLRPLTDKNGACFEGKRIFIWDEGESMSNFGIADPVPLLPNAALHFIPHLPIGVGAVRWSHPKVEASRLYRYRAMKKSFWLPWMKKLWCCRVDTWKCDDPRAVKRPDLGDRNPTWNLIAGVAMHGKYHERLWLIDESSSAR